MRFTEDDDDDDDDANTVSQGGREMNGTVYKYNNCKELRPS